MKYSIEGFSQSEAVNLGLNSEELIVLRWFVDFYATNRMIKTSIGNEQYSWINYKSLLEDLPILRISKQTLSKRIFGDLVKAKILKKKVIKKSNGTFTVFNFDYNYGLLINNDLSSDNITHKLKLTDAKSRNLPVRISKNLLVPPVEIYQPKDPNTKDPNTKDPNTKDIIEQLWKMYPLKKGKKIATQKIKVLLKTYDFEQLQRCIERYKNYVTYRQKTDFKDLKFQNGSTFFNSGYVDYLDKNWKEESNGEINNPKEPTANIEEETEGDRLYKLAKEKLGDNPVDDIECDF